jgi:peptidoglycan/xylan/chitin deacetylase (PgdA/CDA1 family)
VLVACAYALVVASFLGVAEPPVWSLLALALAIAVVVNTGVGFLNLALFVDVLSHGPADRPAVALTFDDGPHPEHTREVLRELAKTGAKATFFLVGRKVDAHPDVVEEIVKAGHEVGLHSYAHDHFLNLRHEPTIVDDLERNQAAIAKLTGRRPMIFRPPVGLTSPRIRVAVKKLGLTVVGWSARAFDGAGRPDPKLVLSRIVPGLEPGAIVLLHDAAERTDARPTSLDALPGLLEEMKARDLRSVTISELVGSARVQASAVPEGAAP